MDSTQQDRKIFWEQYDKKVKKQLASRLRMARYDAKLSVAALSAQVHLPPSTISNYENGRISQSVTALTRIAQELDCWSIFHEVDFLEPHMQLNSQFKSRSSETLEFLKLTNSEIKASMEGEEKIILCISGHRPLRSDRLQCEADEIVSRINLEAFPRRRSHNIHHMMKITPIDEKIIRWEFRNDAPQLGEVFWHVKMGELIDGGQSDDKKKLKQILLNTSSAKNDSITRRFEITGEDGSSCSRMKVVL